MNCPICNSTNVNVQVVNQAQLVNKHHSIWWWILVGWWWIFIKWLVFTVPALLIKVFGKKKQKIKNTTKSVHVCQNCGHTW